MSAILQQISQQGNLLFLGFVFLSTVLFTVALVNLTTSWFGVRRRATSQLAGGDLALQGGGNNLRLKGTPESGTFGALLPKSEKDKSELRRFMNLAGYYSPAAPAVYQITRIVLGLLCGLSGPLVVDAVLPGYPFFVTIAGSLMLMLLGYMVPRTMVSLRRDKLMEEHRQGFPDLLDLLIICVEAGIGIDSGIERVSRDLARAYPSLSHNLQFMTLEMRAGRSTREALGNLADRLGIPEAKSFATLIQQSEELGSSLVQSLRVYSVEMRLKRLSRAEEKAHALPVKLVIPLGFFIFPVLLGVTLFPVVLKIYQTFGI